MIRTPDFERAGKRNISQNPFSRNWPSTSIKETILLQGVPISILRNEHFRLVLRFSGIQQPQLNLLIQTKHLQYTRVPPRKPFGVLKKKQCGDPFMDLFFFGGYVYFFFKRSTLNTPKSWRFAWQETRPPAVWFIARMCDDGGGAWFHPKWQLRMSPCFYRCPKDRKFLEVDEWLVFGDEISRWWWKAG